MSCGCGSCSFLEYSPGRSVATDGTELDHEPCDGAGIVNVAPVPPAPAPEAKEGEMTEQGLRIALEPFYRQGVYVGLAEMQGNAELALAHASRSSEALRPVLAAWTALRTRAREAEEREAKWRRELSAACELSERAREIVVSALNQPPEHYYDKHDNGEWSAEHIAFAIRSLFGERDEAREQRDAIRKHSSAEIGRLGLEVARLRDDFVAANARAEEAEELSEGLAHDLGKADGDRMTALVALDTERAARLRAEAERDEAKTAAFYAFVAGAKWWEFAKTGATMWTGDVREAEEAAQERYPYAPHGLVREAEIRAKQAEERLAAAEAEVKRRDEYPHPCLICFGVRPASGKPCACNGTNNVYTAFDYLNAEAARLRLAYDDPTTDATDGAHPAWWRGSDAGVAGAVRIVNEALDGPLPLPGCVGGADLEAVRQRVAALRASVARLVEYVRDQHKGHVMRPDEPLCRGCGLLADFPAAKADAREARP